MSLSSHTRQVKAGLSERGEYTHGFISFIMFFLYVKVGKTGLTLNH